MPRFFKSVGARGRGSGAARTRSDAKEERRSAPPAPRLSAAPRRSSGHRRLGWLLWLAAGIAVMAGGGYLVAALWLFPAPLLPNERQVPRVLGMAEGDARRDLAAAGFAAVAQGREAHPSAPAGTVIWQDPPPGLAAPKGSSVALTISSGPPEIVVPDVRGYDAAMAQRLLTAAGLTLDVVDTVAVKGLPPGSAAGTSPAAGQSVSVGRSVTLHVIR